MKTEWTTDTYEAGNDYDQTRIMTHESEDEFVEMTEAEVGMLVDAVGNPSGKMPTSTHIVTARRISEIISGVWEKIKAALSKKVDKVSGKGLSTNDFTNSYKSKLDGLDSALSKKVDKVSGKGLSTNDFTNTYKNKLDTAYNTSHTHSNKNVLDAITAAYTTDEKTKLAGLPSAAEIDDTIDQKITEYGAYRKPEDGIPKNDLANDVKTSLGLADTAVQPADLNGYALESELEDKVDKIAGKGLSTNDYTNADKNKLDSIDLDNYVLVPKPTTANTMLMFDGNNMVWVQLGEESFNG